MWAASAQMGPDVGDLEVRGDHDSEPDQQSPPGAYLAFLIDEDFAHGFVRSLMGRESQTLASNHRHQF